MRRRRVKMRRRRVKMRRGRMNDEEEGEEWYMYVSTCMIELYK